MAHATPAAGVRATTHDHPEQQRAGLLRAAAAMAADIKLSHTVFALPFALLAAVLAAADAGALPGPGLLALIVACMFFARTAAMTTNRYADARLDAANPRTAGRAVPSGRVSRAQMLTAALLASGCFIAATAGFQIGWNNPYPLILSVPVLAWLALYSYTKRFTWLCHAVLGVALALSPLAAAIAIHPPYLAKPGVYLLALMVASWVAGFDVIYALQDVTVDRRDGIHSMPAKLGEHTALWVSRGLHLTALTALIALGWSSPALGPGFAVGVAIVAALLITEHWLVRGGRRTHLPTAFFTVNGVISLLLGALGITDAARSLAG